MQQRDGKPPRTKFVIYFTTIDKPLVLNATNKDVLVDALGGTPAKWIGAEIGLYVTMTQFGGKPTPGLRLKVLSAPKAAGGGTQADAAEAGAAGGHAGSHGARRHAVGRSGGSGSGVLRSC